MMSRAEQATPTQGPQWAPRLVVRADSRRTTRGRAVCSPTGSNRPAPLHSAVRARFINDTAPRQLRARQQGTITMSRRMYVVRYVYYSLRGLLYRTRSSTGLWRNTPAHAPSWVSCPTCGATAPLDSTLPRCIHDHVRAIDRQLRDMRAHEARDV